MKKSELVKMIREEVASLLREKSMKRKRIKEVVAVDLVEKGLKDKVMQALDIYNKAKIELRKYQLDKELKAKAAPPATV